MYYRGAQAAIVVYDITNADTFERAKNWVKELQRQVTYCYLQLESEHYLASVLEHNLQKAAKLVLPWLAGRAWSIFFIPLLPLQNILVVNPKRCGFKAFKFFTQVYDMKFFIFPQL